MSTPENPGQPQPPAGGPAVAEPPAATVQPPPQPQPFQQPQQRHCPRCGAAMTGAQEWCLNCGAAVGTRVVPAPGWRVPIIVTALLGIVGAIAIAIAILELADDTGEVTQTPPGAAQVTPTPSAVVPTPTPETGVTPEPTIPEASGETTPEPTPEPTPSSTPEPSGGTIGEWPAGQSGWTVVLASKSSESAAEDSADGFLADGIPDVGILQSDDFASLNPGYWVVFSGEYDSQSQASDALDGIDAKDAYIRRIEPN